MGNNPAQREHAFVAWIQSQRRIHRETPFLVPQVDAALSAASSEAELESAKTEHEDGWARRIPEELIVAAAVLGACVGCPIGSAVGGVLLGFLGGFVGALLGELAVLGLAKLVRLTVRRWRWAG